MRLGTTVGHSPTLAGPRIRLKQPGQPRRTIFAALFVLVTQVIKLIDSLPARFEQSREALHSIVVLLPARG